MTTGERMLHTNAEHEALLAAKPERQLRRHQGKKLRFEGTRWACPHCDATCEIRTSRMLSKTLRESSYACTNPECGHTFVVRASADYTLSPSATPNPTVNMPLSTHVRRGLVRVVLDCADTEDHETQFTPARTPDLFEGGADSS